jgi:superfamily I DNA/RNA helicase
VGLYNIIATSFTKDSSNDLRAKVEASMGSKTDLSTTFIGRTTHSIATELINKFNPVAASKTVLDTNSYQGKKFVLSCFDGIKPGNFATYKLDLVTTEYLLSDKVEEMEGAKQTILSFVNSMLSSAQYGKYRDADYDVSVFENLREKITEGNRIEDADIALVLDGLEKYDAAVATGGGTPSKNRYVKNLEKTLSTDISELGTEDDGRGTVQALGAIVNNYNKSVEKGKKASSNWWELGLDLENKELPKKIKRLLSQRKLSLFITKAKSNVLSPEECFNNIVQNAGLAGQKLSAALKGKKNEKAISQIILSCAYKAYQVKLGETGQRDHDDTIIETVRLLKNNKVRNNLQEQYKHVIVDEAQDLNSAQHMMFGLIAGTYKTTKTKDGKPVRNDKAEKNEGEYSLIGDVKQSIYGFRGATPEQFNHGDSEKATTKDLTLNYRSGSSIVNRMNSFAESFLGETETGAFCTPNYDKSKGQIKKVEKDTAEDAVADFSNDIEEALKNPYGNDRFSDFGVAARTNAELIPYAFSLLEKGIPFRCGVNPFKMRVTSDIINIMKVLSKNERSRSWGMAYASKVFGYDFEKVGIEITDVADAIGEFLKEKKTTEEDWFNNILKMLSNPEDDTAFLAAAEVAEAYYRNCLSKIIDLEGKEAATIFNTILGYAGDSPLMEDGNKLCSKYKDNDQVAEELEKISAGQQDDEGEDGNEDINFTPISYLQRLFTQGVTTAGTYSREDDLAEGEQAVTYSTSKDIDTVLAKLDQMKADAEKASGQMRSAKDVDNDVVVLDTIHGWKGLETKHIYIPMVGGKFPSERLEYDYTTGAPNEAVLKKRKLEEEARLAYVAVTRGKESANIITYKEKIVGEEKKAVKESEFLNLICIDETNS